MSLHGITKGTPLEKMAEMMALGEAKGTMMYYTLARLAKEQGLDDVAAEFIEAANQEAVHAGFYATVNGMIPKDFWPLVRGFMSAEYAGEKKVKAMADKFREAGFAEAADEMEIFAKQEGHHGVVIGKILEKYQPEKKVPAGKVYICPVCGFEHEGDISAEPDDYVCPLCGQPKSAFKSANE